MTSLPGSETAPAEKTVPSGLQSANGRGDEVKRVWAKQGTLLTTKAFAKRRRVTVEVLLDAEAGAPHFSMLIDGKSQYVAYLLKFEPANAEPLLESG